MTTHQTPSNSLARLIDHTLLKPEASETEIRSHVQEALTHSFYSVCVHSRWVPLAHQLISTPSSPLSKSPLPLVVAVAGFPFGANLSAAKAFEARAAVAAGAQEIDMVIDLGALKSQDWDRVEEDIRRVVEACEGRPLKVILETGLLDRREIQTSCEVAVRAGAQFVKSSTGFGPSGASVEAIALMRATVGPEIGVKASGGIRDRQTAEQMIAAGATRLGCSASIKIVFGEIHRSSGGY